MNIFSNFFDIIFSPTVAFNELKDLKPHKLPILIIFIVACFLSATNTNFSGFSSLISAFSFTLVGLIIYSFYIDVMAKMFNLESQFSRMFTLSAFALLPWIFIAPIKLLNCDIFLLSLLSGFLTFGIYIWVIVLQVLAISRAYNTPSNCAVIAIFLPFFGFLMFIGNFTDFVRQMINIFA